MNTNRRTADPSKMDKEVKRKARSKASKKYSRRSSDGVDKRRADELNDRKDLMSRPEDGRNNNPAWYYSDPVLADQISRFSFNQFAGLAKPFGRYIPAIMRLGYNPSPGVSYVRNINASYTADAARDAQNHGINIASQKWWALLAATSGRGAQYTRNDIAILILMLGEVISMYEFIRRFFGILQAYSIRNRVLPQGMLEAAGVDADDFTRNVANYRLRMNNLIVRINQLPIPNNIAYLAKCQDMYQHIYADSDSPMAQFYVQVPISTWMLDEDSFTNVGSILRTYPVVGRMTDDDQNDGFADLEMHDGVQKMEVFIDILEKQINSLLLSSTFSIIYSDLIRLTEKSNLSFWSFDSIKEDYVVVPEYNINALQQIHNTTVMPTLNSFNTHAMGVELNSTVHLPVHLPTLNDVVCEPVNDVVLYNPVFSGKTEAGTNTTLLNGLVKGNENVDLLFDALSADPSIDDRIDGTRYLVSLCSGFSTYDWSGTQGGTTARGYMNFVLPDHWCGGAFVYRQKSSVNGIMMELACKGIGQFCTDVYTQLIDAERYVQDLSKFDWLPQLFMNITLTAGGDTGVPTPQRPIFDLNFYTKLGYDWITEVTDATYIGLFEIR